jgi:hypothetical protein
MWCITWLVPGDELGRVKLYSYPALAASCGTVDLVAHGENVTGVAFPVGGDLITVGGREASLIQWDL